MKSFIAIITLALATAVAANPAAVDKRQTLPSLCVPPGSTLAEATAFLTEFLPPPLPSIITCTTGKTCTAITFFGFALPIGTCH